MNIWQMIVDKPREYRLLKFTRSQTRGKKYDAVLLNKRTRREKRVPFDTNSIATPPDRDCFLAPITAIRNAAKTIALDTPEKISANSAADTLAGSIYGNGNGMMYDV